MSKMTIVQLLAAQRGRELRKQGKPGTWSWIELPFVCILCVCNISVVCVREHYCQWNSSDGSQSRQTDA